MRVNQRLQKHYLVIMPLLLNVLRNAENAKREHQRLRVKAMECAGLIGSYPLSLSLDHTHDRL